MNFSEFVRSKGITQTQLADAMGLCRGAVSKWATGEVFPLPESINNICKGFAVHGITVTYDDAYQALLQTKREKQEEK